VFPPSPHRAIAFADAVRRRVRARPGRVRRRGWAVAGNGPAATEQILRRRGRAGVVHQHRHAGAQVQVRLAVAFDLGGRRPAGGPWTVWRTVAAPVLRAAPTVVPHAATARPPHRPARIELLASRAATTSPNTLPTRVPSTTSFPAPVGRRAASTTPRHRTSPVVMTHRVPAAAGPAAVRSAASASSQSTALHWPADAPASPGATPLTAADLPSVIERVVGELDRRVTAARERRGWTA